MTGCSEDPSLSKAEAIARARAALHAIGARLQLNAIQVHPVPDPRRQEPALRLQFGDRLALEPPADRATCVNVAARRRDFRRWIGFTG
jgi:hypothetical protein